MPKDFLNKKLFYYIYKIWIKTIKQQNNFHKNGIYLNKLNFKI